MVAPIRFLKRSHNELALSLDLEHWLDDVPLPPQTVIVYLDSDPLPPLWKFILEADKTLEIVTGHFVIPLTLEAGYAWFSEALTPHGWQEVKKVHYPPPTIRCSYQHSEYGEQRQLKVQLFYNPHNHEVRVMIVRRIEHLYTPPVTLLELDSNDES